MDVVVEPLEENARRWRGGEFLCRQRRTWHRVGGFLEVLTVSPDCRVNNPRKAVHPEVLEFQGIEILASVGYLESRVTPLIPEVTLRGGEDHG